MLKHMKTTTRLLLSFGMIVALLMAVTIVSISGLRATEADLRQSVESRVKAVTLSQHILSALDGIGLAMRDVVLATDDTQREQALARIIPAREAMTREFEALRALPLSAKGRDLVTGAYEGLSGNVAMQDRFLSLLSQQQANDAIDLLKGEMAQQQAAYRLN